MVVVHGADWGCNGGLKRNLRFALGLDLVQQNDLRGRERQGVFGQCSGRSAAIHSTVRNPVAATSVCIESEYRVANRLRNSTRFSSRQLLDNVPERLSVAVGK